MIRKALLQEIPQLLELTQACAKKMISEGILQWNEHYPNEVAFKKDVERDELFVLFSKSDIVGCITISTHKDEEYDPIQWLTPDATNIYIHRLAIHPKFQHQGFAKQLMDFAERMAEEKKAPSIRLDTFSKNIRNQKFYEARGYTKLGAIFFPKQSEFPFYCYELPLVATLPKKNSL